MKGLPNEADTSQFSALDLNPAGDNLTHMSHPKHRRTRFFVASGLFDGLESFADLEARIAALPTRKVRGDAFEVFAEAYLTTQKIVEAEAFGRTIRSQFLYCGSVAYRSKTWVRTASTRRCPVNITPISRSSAQADRNWIGQSCPRSWADRSGR
jgi:hypothetical protein